MSRDAINSPDAPPAIGPYSHAVRAGEVVYTSGQVGLDPATGELVPGGVAAQTRRAFDNLDLVLRASNLTLRDVVKVNVFLLDMADFAAMNEEYARRFEAPYPARSTVAVAGLPRGARVEIELVAR